jgi:hypothetical protein
MTVRFGNYRLFGYGKLQSNTSHHTPKRFSVQLLFCCFLAQSWALPRILLPFSCQVYIVIIPCIYSPSDRLSDQYFRRFHDLCADCPISDNFRVFANVSLNVILDIYFAFISLSQVTMVATHHRSSCPVYVRCAMVRWVYPRLNNLLLMSLEAWGHGLCKYTFVCLALWLNLRSQGYHWFCAMWHSWGPKDTYQERDEWDARVSLFFCLFSPLPLQQQIIKHIAMRWRSLKHSRGCSLPCVTVDLRYHTKTGLTCVSSCYIFHHLARPCGASTSTRPPIHMVRANP